MAKRVVDRELRITLGGRKIAKYLELSGTGIVAFAQAAKVSRVSIRQVMDGQRWRHIPVGFAIRVARASGGMIAVEDFDSDTATPVGEAKKEPEEAELATSTGTEG